MSDNDQLDLFMTEFKVGDRVELCPSTDTWMRGARFGEIVKIGHRFIHVKLDATGKARRFVPEHIYRKV